MAPQENNGCNVEDPNLHVKKRAHTRAGGFLLILLMLSHTIKSKMLVSLGKQASGLQEIKFVPPPVSAFDGELSVSPLGRFDSGRHTASSFLHQSRERSFLLKAAHLTPASQEECPFLEASNQVPACVDTPTHLTKH